MLAYHPAPSTHPGETKRVGLIGNRMSKASVIPVIDLFAGPGGLGEGFSSWSPSARRSTDDSTFRIALSIEKDFQAWKTLRLRAFFHQFPHGTAPENYYRRLRGEISEDELFANHSDEASAADQQAWNAELGASDPGYDEVRRRITSALH